MKPGGIISVTAKEIFNPSGTIFCRRKYFSGPREAAIGLEEDSQPSLFYAKVVLCPFPNPTLRLIPDFYPNFLRLFSGGYPLVKPCG